MNRIDRDTYELSTGRRIYVSRGVFGLKPDPVEPLETRLTDGYDGTLPEGRAEQGDPDFYEEEPILTAAERREIAEYQIKLWAEWGGVTQ